MLIVRPFGREADREGRSGRLRPVPAGLGDGREFSGATRDPRPFGKEEARLGERAETVRSELRSVRKEQRERGAANADTCCEIRKISSCPFRGKRPVFSERKIHRLSPLFFALIFPPEYRRSDKRCRSRSGRKCTRRSFPSSGGEGERRSLREPAAHEGGRDRFRRRELRSVSDPASHLFSLEALGSYQRGRVAI